MRPEQQATNVDQYRRRQAPQRGGRHDRIPADEQDPKDHQDGDEAAEPDVPDKLDEIGDVNAVLTVGRLPDSDP
jgi:hypothetical protein